MAIKYLIKKIIKASVMSLFAFMAMLCIGKAGEKETSILSKKEIRVVPDSVQSFKLFYSDGESYQLNLAYINGKPDYYYQNIFTPVCLDNVCEPVYVNFYWDLLGNYIRYDIPIGEIFTKIDHEEFSIEDYEKMHKILSNTQSILKDLAMDELVDPQGNSSSSSVDAITGATKKTIKNEVIEGALYTCYTLWHLAHGEVVPEMNKITEKIVSKELLHDFFRSSNYHYPYWAIDHVVNSEELLNEFLPDIFVLVRGKNVFTAKHALKVIPKNVFQGKENQTWLWETFLTSNYGIQIEILELLKDIDIDAYIVEELTENMQKSNEEMFSLSLDIISRQKNLSSSSLRTLGEYLEKSPYPQMSESIFRLLSRNTVKDAVLIKQMESYASKK